MAHISTHVAVCSFVMKYLAQQVVILIDVGCLCECNVVDYG